MRREADRSGDRGEVAERRKRIPVAAAPFRGDVDGDDDVFAAGAVVVAEPLGFLDDVDDLLERRRLFPRRVGLGAGA